MFQNTMIPLSAESGQRHKVESGRKNVFFACAQPGILNVVDQT